MNTPASLAALPPSTEVAKAALSQLQTLIEVLYRCREVADLETLNQAHDYLTGVALDLGDYLMSRAPGSIQLQEKP